MTNKYKDIYAHIEELDAAINEASKGWKTTRMGKVDLTLIRLAVYEIRFEEDIPVKVSINEAIELAKKYGTDDSPAFVNGILAKSHDKEYIFRRADQYLYQKYVRTGLSAACHQY